MEQEAEKMELVGTVDAVLFSNEENGYTVMKLRDENDQVQTVVGCFPYLAPGENLIAYGEFTEHPVYGRQFRSEYAQRILPTSSSAIFEYLAGGAIKGIGPATASLIVNAFGTRSLDILEKEPEKLETIRGISHAKAQEFSSAYRTMLSMRALLDFVCSFSAHPLLALRLYRFYGDRAMETLRTDPYILAAPHIGGLFHEADNMALELGFALESRERIRAGLLFELTHNLNNGHCFLPQGALTEAASVLIQVNAAEVEEQLEELVDSGQIIREELNGTSACYLPEMYTAETGIVKRLTAMNTASGRHILPEEMIEEIEQRYGIAYAREQKDALRYALKNRVLIITGGPGTGKTACLRAILDIYDRQHIRSLLCAPTGRAAKRMAELTGREASTVHRLLEAQMAGDMEKVSFRKNEDDPLDCDMVVLDECSMVDLQLFYALLQALPKHAGLILVGDADQLPPVGPGNIFRSLIESGVFPTVRLTEIFRQAGDSDIVRNAHLINGGKAMDFSKRRDFFRLQRMNDSAGVETILELCTTRLPEKMKILPEEIQVITPTRRGELGTVCLNRLLQKALNPPAEGKAEKVFGEVTFREGDRVMQTRNNYDLMWQSGTAAGIGIYNGDIGYIRRISPATELMEIDFDGKLTQYSFGNLNELEHAWAITVHKSQGSEYKAVVFALSASAKRLLTRSILYTGVTRARDILILVGDENVAKAMIANAKRSTRFTFLKLRLKNSSL